MSHDPPPSTVHRFARHRWATTVVLLAILMLSAWQCGEAVERGGPPAGQHSLTEIVGAPDHVWCGSSSGGRLAEPTREPGGEVLSWTFDGRPTSAAEYVECFPVVTVGRKDVEMRDQIAGYLREDVHQTVGTDTWTRWRKVPLEEALRRRPGPPR